MNIIPIISSIGGSGSSPVVDIPVSTRIRVLIIAGQSNSRGKGLTSQITSTYPYLTGSISQGQIYIFRYSK